MLFIFMLCLCLLTYSLFISFFLICIMHSAFNLFVFPNYMFTSLLVSKKIFSWKGYELSGEIALKNNYYYFYYYIIERFFAECLYLADMT